MSDLASSIVDEIFKNLRGRRFLKWLFDAKGDQCLIDRFADGQELRGLDLEVQQDIRTAWTAIIASRISQQDAELERARAEARNAAFIEAAEIADAAKEMRERLFAENGASLNASKAVQAEEIATALRRKAEETRA